MAYSKVPGTGGKYLADDRGFREIGQSAEMQAATLAIAQQGAALGKQYDPKGTYTAEPRTVAGGWQNEPRAGASIVQVEPGPLAMQHMVMADIVIRLESNHNG